jgi:hypothetical protein
MKRNGLLQLALRQLKAWAEEAAEAEEFDVEAWQSRRDHLDRLIRKLNAPVKRKPGRPERVLPLEEVWNEYHRKVPITALAERYGVSRPTIYRAIEQYGEQVEKPQN